MSFELCESKKLKDEVPESSLSSCFAFIVGKVLVIFNGRVVLGRLLKKILYHAGES